MHEMLDHENEEIVQASKTDNPFEGSGHQYEYYGPNARSLFGFVFKHHQLTRHDEIAILTTSDNTYISTCVTVQCFNYAKISRVITERTKVIILIHEYGYIMDELQTAICNWQDKGIVVIEDCAHIMGYRINGRMVGSFGDYALFSLSKTIPGKYGGLLRTSQRIAGLQFTVSEEEMIKEGRRTADRYLCKFGWFNQRRDSVASLFRKRLPTYEPSAHNCPYFIGFQTQTKDEIIKQNFHIEYGATLRNDLVYIPTNPFVSISEYEKFINSVVDVIDRRL